MNLLQITADTLTQQGGWEESLRLLGVKLINVSDFYELLVRFLMCMVLIFIVVHFIYARNSRRKDFYFSFLVVGGVVFLLCYLLSNVKLELGFALGLFAIFGILRYRTDAIPIKEMTYLFVVIGIAVINALSNKKVSYAELVFTDLAIVFGLWLLEKRLALKQELSIKLNYERIENIHRKNEPALLADLRERTGIDIKRVEIRKIDLLRDMAEIVIFYHPNGNYKKN